MSRARLLPGAVLAAVAGFVLFKLPVAELLLKVVAWVERAGPAGVIVFSVAYVLATVLAVPGSILTLAAGFLYGPVFGLLLVSPVSVAAATGAFLLGRYFAREWVAGKIAGSARFQAIDRAIGHAGLKIILLVRLSPLFPFNLTNYALGLTKVRLSHYVLGSFLGMLPGTFMLVYAGSLATSLAELARGGSGAPGRLWLLVIGLAATIAGGWFVSRIARQELERVLQREGSTPEAA